MRPAGAHTRTLITQRDRDWFRQIDTSTGRSTPRWYLPRPTGVHSRALSCGDRLVQVGGRDIARPYSPKRPVRMHAHRAIASVTGSEIQVIINQSHPALFRCACAGIGPRGQPAVLSCIYLGRSYIDGFGISSIAASNSGLPGRFGRKRIWRNRVHSRAPLVPGRRWRRRGPERQRGSGPWRRINRWVGSGEGGRVMGSVDIFTGFIDGQC